MPCRPDHSITCAWIDGFQKTRHIGRSKYYGLKMGRMHVGHFTDMYTCGFCLVCGGAVFDIFGDVICIPSIRLESHAFAAFEMPSNRLVEEIDDLLNFTKMEGILDLFFN